MNWKILLKDGTLINEYNCGKLTNLKDIDKTQIEKFKLLENGLNSVLRFYGDTGEMKFNNLDLRKLNELPGGSELKLVYDADRQIFKLDYDSLSLMNNLVLREEGTYTEMEFDQRGIFLINGREFFMGFEVDGKLISFRDQGPYQEYIHYKDAAVDFIGKKNSPDPYKRIDNVFNYVIGYNKVHTFEDLIFTMENKILFNTINRSITMEFTFSVNKNVRGSICINYSDNISRIPVTLMADQPARTSKILTMV